MPKIGTKEKFLNNVKIRGFDKRFEYDMTSYKNWKQKMKIRCIVHDYRFEIRPPDHFKASTGCPLCPKETITAIVNDVSQVITRPERCLELKDLIIKSRNKYGEQYNFDDVVYVDYLYTKVIIKCMNHDPPHPFNTTFYNHLVGSIKGGCDICKYNFHCIKMNDKLFVEKSMEIHGKDKFSYNRMMFLGMLQKVTLICNDCGNILFMRADRHIYAKQGCAKCSGRINSLEDFRKKAIEYHGNLFNYDKSIYTRMKDPINIYCNTCHNEFDQTANDHISKQAGCPICVMGACERLIFDHLKKINIKCIIQKTFPDCADKYVLRFDFYIPECNLLIEYDDESHYIKNTLFHKTQDKFEKTIKHDEIKDKYVFDNKFNYMRIPYIYHNKIILIIDDVIDRIKIKKEIIYNPIDKKLYK